MCLIKGKYSYYSGEFTKYFYAQVTPFEKQSLESVGVVIVAIAVCFGPTLESRCPIHSRRNTCMVYVL